MRIFGNNILIEKIKNEQSNLEKSFSKNLNEFEIVSSQYGKVKQLGVGVSLDVQVDDRIVFKPFDLVELQENTALIDQDKVLAKL